MMKFTPEIVVIIVIIILQLYVLIKNIRKITILKRFFPKIVQLSIGKEIEGESLKGNEGIEQIHWENPIKGSVFEAVLKSSNTYLSKNKGTTADFNILKDIAERHIEKHENDINSWINLPLFLGLIGTFLGIIFGLNNISFDSNEVISSDSINNFVRGVRTAMCASLIGLFFTIVASACNRKAVNKLESDKNDYFDFLQRELLPLLGQSMSNSLDAFKRVLDKFIIKFGDNISEYHDTAKLLNENLSSQQLVLKEINKLSLSDTAAVIASTFHDLKDSAEQFDQFRSYQQDLNENIRDAKNVVTGLNTTLSAYENFNKNLDLMSTNINSSAELQIKFKESLEKHFPTIDDHRMVWRQQVDEFTGDVKSVYSSMKDYLEHGNKAMKNFVDQNEEVFSSQRDAKATVEIMRDLTKEQSTKLDKLGAEMNGIRQDFKASSTASNALNQDLVNAIKDLTMKLGTLEGVNKGR